MVGDDLILAFAPLHKRAFGVALGLASGATLAVMTIVAVLRGGPDQLGLLSNYFYGYTVTWTGAAVGFAWMSFVGFCAGWFTAFSRNFIIAASLWLGRTRAELEATRDFLDHI